MPGLIRKEDIAEVRDRVRIDEAVGEYVSLSRAGVDSLKGLCPFHDERTPSFHVRPSLGYWHCFGCSEGGDVISFVQKINSISFAEAVELLAQKAGVTLHYEEGGRQVRQEQPGRRQRLLDMHEIAEKHYQDQLSTPGAQEGRQFLANRGFDQSMAGHFGVGYSPSTWDSLTRLLRARGFTDSEIVTSGLGIEGQRGIYDRFRGRLMWPIREITGVTVGFGARRLDDQENSPKYLNSPETPIFHKSRVLYGLDLAKGTITKDRRIVIVEGYTDVMAAHIAGETTAVATCGTSFGSEHVKIARRLLFDSADPAAGVLLSSGHTHGSEVIFTFDGDEAGRKAALRAFAEDQNFAAQTFVAIENSGMDPCDLRLARGNQAVLELVNSRRPLFEFVIRSTLSRVNLETVEGRVQGLRAVAPIVAGIKDVALRGEYSRSLAGWLAMDSETVTHAIRSVKNDYKKTPLRSGPDDGPPMAGAGRYVSPQQYGGKEGGTEDPVAKVERQALEALLQYPHSMIGSGYEELVGDSFTIPSYRAIHDAVRAIGGLDTFMQILRKLQESGEGGLPLEKATSQFAEVIRSSAGEALESVVVELAVAPLPMTEKTDPGLYARGVMAALVRLDLTRRLADIRSRLQRMVPDDEAYQSVFTDMMRLEQRRRMLSGVDQ